MTYRRPCTILLFFFIPSLRRGKAGTPIKTPSRLHLTAAHPPNPIWTSPKSPAVELALQQKLQKKKVSEVAACIKKKIHVHRHLQHTSRPSCQPVQNAHITPKSKKANRQEARWRSQRPARQIQRFRPSSQSQCPRYKIGEARRLAEQDGETYLYAAPEITHIHPTNTNLFI